MAKNKSEEFDTGAETITLDSFDGVLMRSDLIELCGENEGRELFQQITNKLGIGDLSGHPNPAISLAGMPASQREAANEILAKRGKV